MTGASRAGTELGAWAGLGAGRGQRAGPWAGAREASAPPPRAHAAAVVRMVLMLRASSLAPFPRAVGGSVFSEQSLREEKSRRRKNVRLRVSVTSLV